MREETEDEGGAALWNEAALARYSRHLLLPEVDFAGQRRICEGRVLVVGMGGLGCAAALYLARAGVGTLVVADGDRVDASNVQRQILYREEDIGRAKVAVAAEALRAANETVEVVPIEERLEERALVTLAQRVDVVVDGSDNFATRHAVNRACVAAARPLVSGAAIRFDGQLAVFDVRQGDSPCYSCLFPEQTVAEELRCAVTGVFAPLVGVIGAWQAAETLKLLAGTGRAAVGRLWLFDALNGEWRGVRVPRDPQCSVCSERPR
ncbi:MAG: HesA/MoeB/ThiF family protein [Hydrogenophilus sp.]|nr:HesA/MoeB/ThiF family protein [Hydrogenophilus sp.]